MLHAGGNCPWKKNFLVRLAPVCRGEQRRAAAARENGIPAPIAADGCRWAPVAAELRLWGRYVSTPIGTSVEMCRRLSAPVGITRGGRFKVRGSLPHRLGIKQKIRI